MKSFLFLLILINSPLTLAKSNFGIDMDIEKVVYNKPPNRQGNAGSMIFRSSKISSDSITMDIRNNNDIFDSQLFIRPNFLGFTTKFGSFGYSVDPDSGLKQILSAEVNNSQYIMNDSLLNFSGENLLIGTDKIRIRMQKYRILCQNNSRINLDPANSESFDIVKNCINFSTINGSYNKTNKFADIVFENYSSKTKIEAKLKKLEIKSDNILIDLNQSNISNKNSFFINTKEILIECQKERDIADFQFDQFYQKCMNRLKITTQKVSMVDKEEGTQFVLDLKNFQVNNGTIDLGLNYASIASGLSTTVLSGMSLKCKKNTQTDLLELNEILADCVQEGQLTLQSVSSSEANKVDKNTDTKNIIITSHNGLMTIQADVNFLGMKHNIEIMAEARVAQGENKIILNIKETKLPFGITSVKILMLLLNKFMVSKDIQISNNIVSIAI